MGLMTNYLMTTKNFNDFFDAIIHAKVPERFTQKFLSDLGFTSTNDRLYIGLMKGLGLIDENSVPSEVYMRFIDETQSKTIMADLIREAYEDLFALKKNAQDYEMDELRNKLKTLTQGQKSENVINNMANTFRALCDYADWTPEDFETVSEEEEYGEDAHMFGLKTKPAPGISPSLHYNIQVHLPESRDPAVYDAIFQSLRKHLL